MPQGRDKSDRILEFSADRWVLVGICGSGMQSFAKILRSEFDAESGVEIIGTDSDAEQLDLMTRCDNGLKVIPWNSNWSSFIRPETVVVHSVAVPRDAAILQSARRFECRVLSLPEAIGQLAAVRHQICIAGTHGKTTTTGLVSWILQQAGLEAFHFIGGEFCSTPMFAEQQRTDPVFQADWAVLESCEYRNSFHVLRPNVAIVTGVEPDHFDFFSSLQDQMRSFAGFVHRCDPAGTIIVNSDCPTSLSLARQSGIPLVTCSVESTAADWSMVRVETRDAAYAGWPLGQRAHLFRRGEFVAECNIALPGRHNLRNWLTGIVGAVSCGVAIDAAIGAAGTFPGMRRRFEYRGNWKRIHWVDDYAHHPTAIRETLKTARSVFPASRIIAVVEPHQISRTEHLFAEYVESMVLADEVLVLPVLPARETASLAACLRLSGKLVRKVSESGGRAMLAANLDQVLGRLDHSARPEDVVITMGAGRTHTIHDEIHRRLQRNSAA